MKFIKFWWKHSLRDALLFTLIIVTPIWVSGFIHWYIYPRWGGEDHVKASVLTLIAWFGFGLGGYIGVSVLSIIVEYFKALIREYKAKQP